MSVNEALHEFEQIANWGNGAKTAACCLGFGYLWKSLRWKWLPNEAIPPAVMLFGAAAFTWLSSSQPNLPKGWVSGALTTGFTIGFLTALAHNYGISRLEDLLSKYLPSSKKSDTPKP